MNLSPNELKEIEKQLSCPVDENGIKIADNMHESNLSMTINSIELLNLSSNDKTLEIGHGNCGHLAHVLGKEKGLKYTSLEISETMQKETRKINHEYNADFLIYDGKNIPFKANSFDKIFYVNTIYSWKDSIGFIKEIERSLKKNETLVLTFATKSFMQKLYAKATFCEIRIRTI